MKKLLTAAENSDELYRLPEDPEAHPDEWFGVMNSLPKYCLPRNMPSEILKDTYLVVLSDPPEMSATRTMILELVDRVVMYQNLPLVEIECGTEIAQEIASLPGINFVLPALKGIDKTRSIAIGFDLLASFGEYQRVGYRAFGSVAERLAVGGRARDGAPGYPVIRYEGSYWTVEPDPRLEWPAEPAIMPVINMSLGTLPIDYPFLRNDIVNLATYGVASAGLQLIVVAAGNCGQMRAGPETMSAWAQAPWVLSVGATEDVDGKKLAAFSAIGMPDDPESGPDVVAWGQSAIPPYPLATSYAAPRVSFCALIYAAALLELRHGFQVAAGQTVEGVRLVGIGYIDSWKKEIWGEKLNPRISVPCLPIIGIDMDGVRSVSRLATDHGINLDVRGSAEILRRLLLAAAKPIPNYERHEIGAGFLSEEIVLDHVANLSGADILTMFATDEIPSEVSAAASHWRVFDRSQLTTLAHVVAATAPSWQYDWRTQRIGARLFIGEELSELSHDEQVYGMAVNWPPAPLKPQR